MLILDTHVLVWMDQDDSRLGVKARKRIDRALAANTLGVCAISFWEVAMLVQKKRLSLPMPTKQWRRELLAAGLQELLLDGQTNIAAAGLEDFHGDPADRLIVAVAQEHDAMLLTADERILAWKGKVSRGDARG